MQHAARHVEAISNCHIRVEFVDGTLGFFDVSPYWHQGALRELQDAQYFKRVGIDHGCVTWPHGQDIAPLTLYENLQHEQPLQASGT